LCRIALDHGINIFDSANSNRGDVGENTTYKTRLGTVSRQAFRQPTNELRGHFREVELAEGEMPTNAKETKGVGKALINAFGFLSFLFGSLVLLAIAFGTIGGLFMSTKRLFQVKRVKRDEDNSRSEPEGRGR